jgi:hypothetical protein
MWTLGSFALMKEGKRVLMRKTRISQASGVARPRKPTIRLPPHVNVVWVKGRQYYYYHPGRGTKRAGKPVRLPNNPSEPEFVLAYRKAANEPEPPRSRNSIEALIEAYQAAPEWSRLADSTRTNWQLYLDRIKGAWGLLEVRGIEPKHVLAPRSALDSERLSRELERSAGTAAAEARSTTPPSPALADKARWPRLPRPAQVCCRDAARSWVYYCRGAGHHRPVDADGGALRQAS